MRFSDLYVAYKIGLKENKENIKESFHKLPRYRKVFVLVMFSILGIYIVLLISQIHQKCLLYIVIGMLAILIIFGFVDSKKENMKKMLDEHYKPYSTKRMEMLKDILNDFNVDSNDNMTIDLLIIQAKEGKKRSDILGPLVKPIKYMWAIILPITAYTMKRIAEEVSTNQLVIISIQIIMVIVIVIMISFAIFLLFRELNPDYSNYDQLIYDLEQLKIFKEKND